MKELRSLGIYTKKKQPVLGRLLWKMRYSKPFLLQQTFLF
jgi:hypothetical protein